MEILHNVTFSLLSTHKKAKPHYSRIGVCKGLTLWEQAYSCYAKVKTLNVKASFCEIRSAAGSTGLAHSKNSMNPKTATRIWMGNYAE